MKHKVAIISLALTAMVFAFSGCAWAGGRDGHSGQRYDRGFRYGGPHAGPFGWHQDRGHHVSRFYHAPRHGFRQGGWHGRPAQKHVYRHYGGHRHAPKRYYHHSPRRSHSGVYFSFDLGGRR